MKLTGKTREDFENWILNECQFTFGKSLIKIHKQKYFFISYLGIDNIQLNALIIEFFDSVGIYIQISIYTKRIDSSLDWCYSFNEEIFERFFKSRKEATDKAIEKANEIYNNKLA